MSRLGVQANKTGFVDADAINSSEGNVLGYESVVGMASNAQKTVLKGSITGAYYGEDGRIYSKFAMEDYSTFIKQVHGSQSLWGGLMKLAPPKNQVDVAILNGEVPQAIVDLVYEQAGSVDTPNIVNSINTLPWHPTKTKWRSRSLDAIGTIVVHETGGQPTASVPSINDYHIKGKGWPRCGYHFLITSSGVIHQCNKLSWVASGQGWINSGAIGVSFIGNFPPERRSYTTDLTGAQKDAFYKIIPWLAAKFQIIPSRIMGHIETDVLVGKRMKSCPGTELMGMITQLRTNVTQAFVDQGVIDMSIILGSADQPELIGGYGADLHVANVSKGAADLNGNLTKDGTPATLTVNADGSTDLRVETSDPRSDPITASSGKKVIKGDIAL